MSYRDAFRPCSRVSSGEKNNTYLNMQWHKTATKNLETKISSNLESLNFQTCTDIKLQLPHLEIKIASINTSALSMQILQWRQTTYDMFI